MGGDNPIYAIECSPGQVDVQRGRSRSRPSMPNTGVGDKVERHAPGRKKAKSLVRFDNNSSGSISTGLVTVEDADHSACFTARFEDAVLARPDKVALTSRRGILSYHMLNVKANQLAWHLKTLRVGPEGVVGVALERGIDHIVSMIAIWKARGAYLPLDTSAPCAQLKYIMKESDAQWLISSQTIIKKSDLQEYPHLLLLDDLEFVENMRENPIQNLTCQPTGRDLACIRYTSGTSGDPKGVTITHNNLTNLANDMCTSQEIKKSDRVLLCSAFSFDASMRDVIGSLLSGAKLHIPDAEDVLPGNLTKTMRHEHTSYVDLTPTLLRNSPLVPLPRLETIVLAGEACSRTTITTWGQGRTVIYAYGPAEATVCSSRRIYTNGAIRTEDPVSIGLPTLNMRMYVLHDDEAQTPVNLGEVGEIYIGGLGVSQRGYLNQANLNATAFLRSHLDPGRLFRTGDLGRALQGGEIEFVGRKDSQVKINGVRIEILGTENRLRTHPAVQDAVITVSESVMVAYVVLKPGFATAKQQHIREKLRIFLQYDLHSRALPKRFVFVSSLPINTSNKIAINALKTIPLAEEKETASARPLSEDEMRVAKVLRDTITQDSPNLPLHADTTYEEAGGDSVMVQRILDSLREEFGPHIQMKDFYQNPQTIESLAELATKQERPCHEDFEKNLLEEVRLPLDIFPINGHPQDPGQRFAEHVLLTGATGYLGAHVLAQLLSDGTTKVSCVVRASDSISPFQRIQNALQSWNLWSDAYSNRVRAFNGDVAESKLGLQPDDYEDLARTVQRIWHCAATVNFIMPYSSLYGSNVIGSIEIMRFACALRDKHLVFVSTLATFYGAGKVIHYGTESSTQMFSRGIVSGYAQTKWVAEQLVVEFERRGGKALILRLGEILGTSLVQTGVCPDLDWRLDFTPVDVCTKVMADLAKQSLEGIFHVVNPQSIALHDIADLLRQSGHMIKLVPYESWRDEHIVNSESLRPFLSFFEPPGDSPEDRSAFEVMLDTLCIRTSRFETLRTVESLNDKSVWDFPSYTALFDAYSRSHLLNDARPIP